MVYLIANDLYHVVLGSRILGNGALKGGMPYYKYVSNRFLTFFQNLLIGQKLSEYHTGFRAYRREVLDRLPWEKFSNNFVFDQEILISSHANGFTVGEIAVPVRYFPEASSINFFRSVNYGLQIIIRLWLYLWHQMGIRQKIYTAKNKIQ